METRSQIRARAFVKVWTSFVVLAVYLPILCGAMAGLSRGRYFGFPINAFSTEWWGKTLGSLEIQALVQNSLLIAFIVTLVSVIFAFFGALAFARYDWKGRKLSRRRSFCQSSFRSQCWGSLSSCGSTRLASTRAGRRPLLRISSGSFRW